MRIKREKSVVTGFDFKSHIALPTEGILYEGVPLTGLAPDEAFAYLGVRGCCCFARPAPAARPGGDGWTDYQTCRCSSTAASLGRAPRVLLGAPPQKKHAPLAAESRTTRHSYTIRLGTTRRSPTRL